MTYGDGDGVDFGPLVSLDVAGHEMTHGVTQNTANGNDPGDYLIGEEFDLANHVGFRRMDRPNSDGSSYDCYQAGIGNADVHYSSGVGNHVSVT